MSGLVANAEDARWSKEQGQRLRRRPSSLVTCLPYHRDTDTDMIDYRGLDVKALAPGIGVKRGTSPASLESLRIGEQRRLAQALRDMGFEQKAQSVELCGMQYVHLACKKCGKEWDTPWRCDNRMCPRCSSRRAQRLYDKYRHLLCRPRLKHLILTVPNVAHIRGRHIAWLKSCFKKLRRRKRYQEAWKGGICSIEVPFHEDTGFNYHAHILLEGAYVAQAEILADWAEITGCSKVVYIKEATDPSYVLKDIVKPGGDLSHNPQALIELLEAIYGRRLAFAWGTWYNSDHLCDAEPIPCPFCGSAEVDCVGTWLPRPGGRKPILIDYHGGKRGPPCPEGDNG